MTVFLSILGVLVPASVTLVGFWFKRQSEERLAQEKQQSEKRIAQEKLDEQRRLRLDAAMQAASLFENSNGEPPSPAAVASGLLALAELGDADLAVALLVDLWSSQPTRRSAIVGGSEQPTVGVVTRPAGKPGCVSKETAVLVVNKALTDSNSSAQLVAAEVLCRNAESLDPCKSLEWPAAIDGLWISDLPMRAKLLIVDGLISMTLNADPSENALRALAVRLYGVWAGDSDNPRVQGCIGTLISAILPALRRLDYSEFVQSQACVSLSALEHAANSASPNPDGFLERLVLQRSSDLEDWSSKAVERCGSSLETAAPFLTS